MGYKMLLEEAVKLKECADKLISYAKYLEREEDEEKDLPDSSEDSDKKKMIVAILRKKLDK